MNEEPFKYSIRTYPAWIADTLESIGERLVRTLDSLSASDPSVFTDWQITDLPAKSSFRVQDHGRWCNVPAVIDGLNDVLARLELPERFIELQSGTSDVALVTFARADLFMPLASELGIPLGRSD